MSRFTRYLIAALCCVVFSAQASSAHAAGIKSRDGKARATLVVKGNSLTVRLQSKSSLVKSWAGKKVLLSCSSFTGQSASARLNWRKKQTRAKTSLAKHFSSRYPLEVTVRQCEMSVLGDAPANFRFASMKKPGNRSVVAMKRAAKAYSRVIASGSPARICRAVVTTGRRPCADEVRRWLSSASKQEIQVLKSIYASNRVSSARSRGDLARMRMKSASGWSATVYLIQVRANTYRVVF